MEKQKNTNLVITFRTFQAISLGLLALGLSMCMGDISEFIKIPVSNFALTTTIFGGLGAVISGKLAENCEKW